ncbi:MAG: hypothetical protein WBZ29_11690 [Methanocella sp.]
MEKLPIVLNKLLHRQHSQNDISKNNEAIHNLIIRDFIYMDVDRLKSIIAQKEEGLIDSLMISKDNSEKISSSVEGLLPPFLKSRIGSEYVFENKANENKILHDFIYNKVENSFIKEKSLINIPDDLSFTDVLLRNKLTETSFVLIKSKVIINDFTKMLTLVENYDDILLSLLKSGEVRKLKEKAEVTGKKNYHKEKEELTKKVDRDYKDNPPVDVETLNVIKLFITNFYKGRIQIKSLPYDGHPEIRFTGLLNNAYLRDDITTITYKYGTAPASEWNIFAQIASIPPKKKEDLTLSKGNEIDNSMHIVFNRLRDLEEIAGSSVNYPEISITPIVIYRD